ncbi:MAG: transposase [Acidobacteriaceae bacterium]|nr:transposase [Acidobacteriaceae bacterium]MBV9938787.1 transposase [Acidobacteriaceae bacterium]
MTPVRRCYDTDLSDAEWALLAPLLPPEKPGGRDRENDLREVINGIRYLLRTGAAWRHVPHEFPHWNLCYQWFRHWRQDGSWQHWQTVLREHVRQQFGRNQTTSTTTLSFYGLRASAPQ